MTPPNTMNIVEQIQIMDSEKTEHIQDTNELTPKKLVIHDSNELSISDLFSPKSSRKRISLDQFELETPNKKFKMNIMNTTEPGQSSAEYRYSDLKYIETFGILRICQSKHRNNSVGSIDDRTSNQSLNRSIQLQISYRINTSNENDIQFALVVYQHFTKNPKIRRNLMNEFSDETNDESMDPITTSPPLPPQLDTQSEANVIKKQLFKETITSSPTSILNTKSEAKKNVTKKQLFKETITSSLPPPLLDAKSETKKNVKKQLKRLLF